MLVTIIVPVFNRFAYADRAIASVINQTYNIWELIIIDDCSEEIYKPNVDFSKISNRVLTIRNEINKGPGLSRQRGLEMAKGDFVCFLDSDDFYAIEFLQKSIDLHIQNPEIRASYTTALYVDQEQIRPRSDISFNEIVPTILTGTRPWPTCGMLWKNINLPIWRSLRTNQDYWFEIENAMINNRIKHIPEVLCYVDKTTFSNSDDLVHENQILNNRNIVYQFALANFRCFKIVESTTQEIKKKAIKCLFYSTEKLLKYGNSKTIWSNCKVLLNHNPIAAFKLIPVWIFSHLVFTRKIGLFYLKIILRY